VLAPSNPVTLPPLLHSNDIRNGFDCLALACDDASAIWESLAAFRPRAVVCSGSLRTGLAQTAKELGYARIASEKDNGDTVFLRSDLLDAAAFDVLG
jgi:hypothetical protein